MGTLAGENMSARSTAQRGVYLEGSLHNPVLLQSCTGRQLGSGAPQGLSAWLAWKGGSISKSSVLPAFAESTDPQPKSDRKL